MIMDFRLPCHSCSPPPPVLEIWATPIWRIDKNWHDLNRDNREVLLNTIFYFKFTIMISIRLKRVQTSLFPNCPIIAENKIVCLYFKVLALWAEAFYKSKYPYVCLSVCVCVCSLLRYRLTVFLPPLGPWVPQHRPSGRASHLQLPDPVLRRRPGPLPGGCLGEK